MIDSLTADQIAHVVRLGEWRDEGHLLAVGRDGEVFIHPADKGDDHVATEQREGAARRQGPSGRQGAARPGGAKAPAEPACKDGLANVRQQYSTSMPEVREFYPDLRVIDVEDGIWVVTQIFPIGRDGPFFSLCLFLADEKTKDAKAFAFHRDGRRARPVAERHTNFPDMSVCAFIADDDVWEPGESPLILLNLYAEWLLCQMFFASQGVWPGRQFGANAVYRQQEFNPEEWCFCTSEKRYGKCHLDSDALEVRRLKELTKFKPLDRRNVPYQVIAFAKSRWQNAPEGSSLHLHNFRTQEESVQDLAKRTNHEALMLLGLDHPFRSLMTSKAKSRLLSGGRA